MMKAMAYLEATVTQLTTPVRNDPLYNFTSRKAVKVTTKITVYNITML